MKISVPVITDETRAKLNAKFTRRFPPPEGNDLSAVVSEILHDKDVFTWLAAFTKLNQGLRVGYLTFWSDIQVYQHYGLMLAKGFDALATPKLFTYETWGAPYSSLWENDKVHNFELRDHFPRQDENPYDRYPTSQALAAEFNHILQSPQEHYILTFELIPESPKPAMEAEQKTV